MTLRGSETPTPPWVRRAARGARVPLFFDARDGGRPRPPAGAGCVRGACLLQTPGGTVFFCLFDVAARASGSVHGRDAVGALAWLFICRRVGGVDGAAWRPAGCQNLGIPRRHVRRCDGFWMGLCSFRLAGRRGWEGGALRRARALGRAGCAAHAHGGGARGGGATAVVQSTYELHGASASERGGGEWVGPYGRVIVLSLQALPGVSVGPQAGTAVLPHLALHPPCQPLRPIAVPFRARGAGVRPPREVGGGAGYPYPPLRTPPLRPEPRRDSSEGRGVLT